MRPSPIRAYARRLARFKAILTLAGLLCTSLYFFYLGRRGYLTHKESGLGMRTGDFFWTLPLNIPQFVITLLAIGLLGYAAFPRLRRWGPASRRTRALAFFGLLLPVVMVPIDQFFEIVDFQPPFLAIAMLAALILSIVLVSVDSGPSAPLARLGRGLNSAWLARWLPWISIPAGIAFGYSASRTIYDNLIVVIDAQSQIAQARLLLTGHLTLAGTPDFVHSVAFPLSTGTVPAFSQYPPGHILFEMLALALGFQPRIVGIAASAFGIPLAMAFARRIGGRTAGVFAGLLLFFSPWLMIMSPSAMNHTTAGLALALAAWCLLPRGNGREAPFWILALGWGCIGWTLATRPLTGLAHGAVWGAILGWDAIRLRQFSVKKWSAAALGIVPPLVVLFLYQLGTSGHLLTLGYTARDPALHYLGFRSTGPYPFTPLDSLNDFASSLFSLNRLLFCLPFGAWVLAAVWGLGTRLGRTERILVLLVAAQTLAYRFYHYHDLLLGPRFLYELLPILAALGGAAMARMVRGGFARRGLALVLLLSLVPGCLDEASQQWSGKWAIAKEKGDRMRRGVALHVPYDRPTVMVIPDRMEEDMGVYAFAQDARAPQWFVPERSEVLARTMPEFAGMRWERLAPKE